MLLVFYMWYCLIPFFVAFSGSERVPFPGPCFVNRPPLLLYPHWPKCLSPASLEHFLLQIPIIPYLFFPSFFCFSSQKIIYICCFYICNHLQSGSCPYQTMKPLFLKVTYDSGPNLLFCFFLAQIALLASQQHLADNAFWQLSPGFCDLTHSSFPAHNWKPTLWAWTVSNRNTFWDSLCLSLPFEKGIIVPTA